MTIRIEKPEFLFREQLNAVDSNIPVSKMPNGSVIQVATRHRQVEPMSVVIKVIVLMSLGWQYQ